MTLKTRNLLLLFGLAVILFITLVCLYFGIRILMQGYPHLRLPIRDEQRWLFLRWQHPGAEMHLWIIAIMGQAIFALIVQTILIWLFWRIGSYHILFYSLFIIGASLHTMRVLQFPIMEYRLAQLASVIVTRVVYFGYLSGRMALLLSGLYLIGVDYRRAGTAIGIITVLALALTYSLPVDTLTLLPNLLHPVGDERNIQIAAIIIELLIILNVLYAIIDQQSLAGILALVGLALTAIGWDIWLYLIDTGAIIVAILLTVGGAMLLISRSYSLYLWER